MRWTVLATALAAMSLPAPALAAQRIVAPPGTDNLEFEFAGGACTDRIRIKVVDNDGTFVLTTYGCSRSLKKFRWETEEAFAGFDLFGVFLETAKETVGRRVIRIKDAYWTSGPAFAEPLWSDGKSRVVIVPEPASWVLMIAGFAAVGMGLRRRALPT